jgi:hypothetical protein
VYNINMTNYYRKLLAWLREEGTAGEYLKPYEMSHHLLIDYHQSITVPPDAETFADVSFYQEGMNWSTYPPRAAIIRVGQGPWKDTSFETFYQQAKIIHNKALGCYVFFDDRYSPAAHRDMVVSAMAGKDFEMEIFVDVERSYSGAYGGPANVRKLIELLRAAGLRVKDVGVYTGYYYWRSFSSGMSATDAAFFASVPLWLAWYASPSVVLIPSPWTTWTHWQYGTPVEQWGQPTLEIDANRHNGTAAEFAQRYLGGTPPPPGGDMHIEGTVVVGALKIRMEPGGAEYSPPRYLYNGDKIKASDVVGSWLKLTEINGVASVGWSSAGSNQEYVRWVWVQDPEPPPPPVSEDEIKIFENGVLKYHIKGKLQ